jgi:hypothetical protein
MDARRTVGSEGRARSARLVLHAGLAAAYIGVVLTAASCSKGHEGSSGEAETSLDVQRPQARSDASPDAGAPAAGIAQTDTASAAGSASVATQRRAIIYTGETTLEVDDVEKTTGQAEQALATAGGWIAAKQLHVDSEGLRIASLSMRIPSAKFSSLHDDIRRLGEVVYDEIHSQDVGMEFVDLEARARNLQREESVIAELFQREGKIGDVLQVEHEMARVRGEIEQVQGRLRYLTDQVGFSTLTVDVRPRRPAIERKVASWDMGYHVLRAWHALVAVARALTYFVIYGVIVVGPFALLGWAAWRLARSRRRRASK